MLIAAVLLPMSVLAQRIGTRTGDVSFFSSTPMGDIKADNHAVACVYDAGTGAVEVSMLMKAFEFAKAKMQEDFNESYVESDKYPKSTLNGKVTGFSAGDLKKAGTYKAKVEGDLTLHGVTKHVVLDAQITADGSGGAKVSTDFIMKPEDYQIIVPALVRDKIAREVKVTVQLDLKPL
jgi:polyisoprenoid-binding protein YceI